MTFADGTIEVDAFVALTIGIVVFFLGRWLTGKVSFFRTYNIPEPVTGGLAVSVLTLLVFIFFDREVSFDLAARDVLLVYFFTIVGLNATLSDLARGGKPLVLLLGATLVLMVVQNTVGLLAAVVTGWPAAAGVLLGTASLIGGHGTAIAWGPTVAADYGVIGAAELGVATATLGLIAASLLGGPIAKLLIERNNLTPTAAGDDVFAIGDRDAEPRTFDHVDVMGTVLAIHVAIVIGYAAFEALREAGVKLPVFVPCLLSAIFLTNTVPRLFPGLRWPSKTPATAMVSEFSLSVFLAMSLMSMQLWTLAGSTTVLALNLVLQVAATAAFIYFILFRLMGSNYFAGVLSAGFAGFTLGATPTAIANMSAVTKRYGPSPLAFIVLPLVAAFFVDLANAVLIQLFLAI
ncbi:MAG: sodium/glutamate symporter [Pseudomonadota bacterium]